MGLELMLALKLVDCLESCWNCAIRFFLTKVLLKIKSNFSHLLKTTSAICLCMSQK